MSKRYDRVSYSFLIADLLHLGHVNMLKAARDCSEYHVCGLLSDEVSTIWQGLLVCNFEERKTVLEALECVDEVVVQDSLDPTDNLKMLRKRFPESRIMLVHGDDWRTVPGREFIESVGGEIVQPPFYPRLSRDYIISRFRGLIEHEAIPRPASGDFMVGDIVRYDSHAEKKLLSTKADTLKNFRPLLVSSKIEKLFVVTVEDFEKHEREVVKAVRQQFGDCRLVVRSSSVNEDMYHESNAGYFLSVIDVDSRDGEAVKKAAMDVISSYRRHGEIKPQDQLLIQRQTLDIKMSGVVFTRNLQNNTPYYLINYDDETGKTDSVTGGGSSKLVRIYRGAASSCPPEWKDLLAAIGEIESHLSGMVLDIEFAEQNDGTIVIFQIRPLAANVRHSKFDDARFDDTIRGLVEKYRESGTPDGGKGLFSDMAFWNPAEIIGDNPHPLDYSLYREIITKKAWNVGLVPMGYGKVAADLMARFGNKPYINLHHTFNCLTPAAVRGKLRKKIVGHCVEKLKANPSSHDKVEFEIAHSCYDFETKDKLRGLKADGFTDPEIRLIEDALRELTVSVIKGHDKRTKAGLKDLAKLGGMTAKAKAAAREERGPHAHIKDFISLIDSISRLGTPQFSAVAREAFIAKSFSNSMVSSGLFTRGEVDSFLEGVETVTSGFDRDFNLMSCGRMSMEKFMEGYGHLRAGTYDITSACYERMDFGRLSSESKFCATPRRKPKASELDRKKLARALKESGLDGVTPAKLTGFIRSSIMHREYFKFEFTKALSLALEVLAEAGGMLGISREELAFLDMPAILSFGNFPDEAGLADFMSMYIDRRRAEHERNSLLELPPMITDEADFVVVKSFAVRPNFITQKTVSGEVVDLDTEKVSDVSGKIVLTTRADPGYDWIFSQKIKGLITEYGGAASHMAIRCAEFGIPAAIGCGEDIFRGVRSWKCVRLNCRKKRIYQVPC